MTPKPGKILQRKRAALGLRVIWQGYDDYNRRFAAVTERARSNFERSDWLSMRADTLARLDTYEQAVSATKAALEALLEDDAHDTDLWRAMRMQFGRQARPRRDPELACTFYNSVNRRIFRTVGIKPRLEFNPLSKALETGYRDAGALFFTPEGDARSGATIRALLGHYNFQVPYQDPHTDARLCARRLEAALQAVDVQGDPRAQWRFEMLSQPFFRDTRAYLIGRACSASARVPVVFALANGNGGLRVDALLTTDAQIRILFSFSRAYFHVRTACVTDLVCFLKELMPLKRTAELYIVLGFHKHGKTELYRDLLRHRKMCGLDRFERCAGQRGMVMIAFNMPSDDLVYKVIRDRFASPKRTSRQRIMEKYDFVFKHDRAGRLVDVQTFENLKLEQCCFDEQLLAEIRAEARQTVSFKGSHVILHHVYVERRVTPLDVYLQTADARQAGEAVLDYGRAIKDLAMVDVFPGDMLLKNFGVTRLGRVVFYDYDELCRLTECNIRRLPAPRRYEDALEAEPWFSVADNDVFPEEFESYLGMAPDLKAVFLSRHGDLLEPEFWRRIQKQLAGGYIMPILPYSDAERLG